MKKAFVNDSNTMAPCVGTSLRRAGRLTLVKPQLAAKAFALAPAAAPAAPEGAELAERLAEKGLIVRGDIFAFVRLRHRLLRHRLHIRHGRHGRHGACPSCAPQSRRRPIGAAGGPAYQRRHDRHRGPVSARANRGDPHRSNTKHRWLGLGQGFRSAESPGLRRGRSGEGHRRGSAGGDGMSPPAAGRANWCVLAGARPPRTTQGRRDLPAPTPPGLAPLTPPVGASRAGSGPAARGGRRGHR